MYYLPTLRLNFPDGTLNEYRLRQHQIEFLTNDGTWRMLEEADIQMHFILHTDVAKWLLKETANAKRTGTN
jgi:hypothetical protein